MDRLISALKAQAAALDQGQAQPRFGLVTSVDPVTASARVSLQPEGVLSGWLPVLSPWIGSGWGAACPPSPGDQVLVLAQEGNAEHGVIIGRAFSASQPSPPAPAGELWLVHQSGAFLKLQNDGTIHINGPVAVVGDVTVTGSVRASVDLADGHGTVATLRGHYDAHTHVDSGGSTTASPLPQD